MKKRWLVPLIWGFLTFITLILGWISFYKYQAIPETLITVVCGGEGIAITFTGVLGIVEVIKGVEKDETDK